MSMQQKHYSVQQAALILKVHRNTLLRMVRDGRIEMIKLGRFCWFTRRSVHSYIGHVPKLKELK